MISKIRFSHNKVAVIGLGYVGLPLVKQLIKKRFDVIGFDIDQNKIKQILKINKFYKKNKKIFSSKPKDLNSRNLFIVCVPTPITKSKEPDLSALKLASEIVGKKLKEKSIVIYESTVYPGCTEEFCVPILEKHSKLKINEDFYCGYSPERINPEDKKHTLENIIKVTSGSNTYSSNVINKLYKILIPAGTYQAESIKIAEAAKVIENVQRDLNIALVNEFSLIFDRMKLNTHEVLKAASTKWNFLNFKPGLVGGHCIGVDPYYLTYKAKKLNYTPRIILAGRKINDEMSKKISNKVIKFFSHSEARLKKVLILGFSFKENSEDTRNTKIVDLFRNLKKHIKHLDVYDPLVDSKKVYKDYKIKLLKRIKFKNDYDALILAVPHLKIMNKIQFKYKKLLKKKSLIIDLKNKLQIKNF